MGSRRRSREMVIQVLYQADMTAVPLSEAFQVFCGHFGGPEDIRMFAYELVSGVEEHREVIDHLISRFSEHWRLGRMTIVDRNIIRMAVFEFLYRPDIPAKVSINEAVDLGKKFGSEDSGAFINGVLDKIRLYLEGDEGREKGSVKAEGEGGISPETQQGQRG
jgi:N utilization substance protein B